MSLREKIGAQPGWIQVVIFFAMLIPLLLVVNTAPAYLSKIRNLDSQPAVSNATKNIGIKYEDFANNFNAKKSEFIIADGLEFKIKPNSDTAELSYDFNPSTALNVKIDKTSHQIQQIYIIKAVGGDNNDEKLKSVFDAQLISSIATQALNPTIPKEQIGKLIIELFGAASKHQNIEQKTVINGMRYIAKFDTEFTAYIFAVKP